MSTIYAYFQYANYTWELSLKCGCALYMAKYGICDQLIPYFPNYDIGVI